MKIDLSKDDVNLLLSALNAVQVSGRDSRRAVALVENKLDEAIKHADVPVEEKA